MVQVFKEQKVGGSQAGNGWKPQAYQAVVEKLAEEGSKKGPAKTAKMVSDHYAYVCCRSVFGNLNSDMFQMKKCFKMVHTLKALSGFGWDDETKMLVATEQVWSNYIKVRILRGFLWISD